MVNNNNMEAFLQQVYIMDSTGDIYYCNEEGKYFWNSIDFKSLYSHIQSLRFNTAITNTTIIINDTSFNLYLIPIRGALNYEKKFNNNTEYIVMIKNQALYSSILYKLNNIKFSNNYEELNIVFKDIKNGIFLVDSNNFVVYANDTYQKLTGIYIKEVINKSLFNIEKEGKFTPLISPYILKTYDDYTAFQTFSTGKFAIVSGSIVCDNVGNSIYTIACPNMISNPSICEINKKLYSSTLSKAPNNDNENSVQIDIIAESEEMHSVLKETVRIAHFDVTVLLLGESGTGKEVLASIIHNTSNRRYGNFVKINCSALTPSLLDAELFGYEPGAFTGALASGKKGLFEIAQDGTILLDEIGELPLESQAKLLRVLQEKEIYRVGSNTPIKINARIIASTNRDLNEMVAQNKFRCDLYYRLNVVSITLPPLRNRKADIKPLIIHFSYLFNKKYGLNKVFSIELIRIMERYSWPGNVRELRNIVERLTLVCNDYTLYPEHLFYKYPEIQQNVVSSEINSITTYNNIPLNEAIKVLERKLIKIALIKGKSTRKAARILDVSQSTIVRKIKEYNIEMDNLINDKEDI